MSFERCSSEPSLRRARDPAEKRFLTFLEHNKSDFFGERLPSQKHRPSRTQTPQVEHKTNRQKLGLRIDRSHQSSHAARCAPGSPMTAFLRRPSSALSPGRDSPGKIAIRNRVLSKIAIGLHVALLNAKISQKPGEIQLEEPMERATVEHVQRIYRQFLRFKALELDRAAEARYLHQIKLIQEAWCENSREENHHNGFHLPTGPPNPSSPENPLSRLRWPTFIHWLEQEASCGIQQTYRRSVAALLRGVKLWRQICASKRQAEGISLGLLLSWAFPSSSSSEIAEMLSWLALQEIEAW